MSKQLELTLSKETKHTFVYKSKNENPLITSLYPVPRISALRSVSRMLWRYWTSGCWTTLSLATAAIALPNRGSCDVKPASKLFLADPEHSQLIGIGDTHAN
jgi:hypothetical protein